MVKYGVVGVGYFGAELARIMKAEDDTEIVAVFDPENGKTIAEELGCDTASSLEELVSREDIDCVIVATPNYLHKEPVIAAAKHGKNVFCEKPIALSYADCDEMVKACEENNVVFMAGHIMNFFNGVHHAKELINEGCYRKSVVLPFSTQWLGRCSGIGILEKNQRKIRRPFVPPHP